LKTEIEGIKNLKNSAEEKVQIILQEKAKTEEAIQRIKEEKSALISPVCESNPLFHENNSLKEQLKSITEKLLQTEAEANDLRLKVKKDRKARVTKGELEDMRKGLIDLETRSRQLTDDIATKSKKIYELQHELEKQIGMKSSLEKENSDQKMKIADLEEQVKESRRERHERNLDSEQLRSRLKASKDESNQLRKEIEEVSK
jgi:chromosome segregation ATPase